MEFICKACKNLSFKTMAEWCEHVAKVHIPADPDKEKDHEQALNPDAGRSQGKLKNPSIPIREAYFFAF